MNELREKEYELFKKWKMDQKYDTFVNDGVFSPEQWEKEKIKIIFFMKEPNWEGDGDLIEWILSEKSPTYWKTWNNIARWTKALLEGGDYLKSVDKKEKTYWLSRVGFINIKKVGGGSKSDNDVIREYAKDDSKFLFEQLNLY